MIKTEKFDGMTKETEKCRGLTIERTTLFDEQVALEIGKKCGEYISIRFPYLFYEDKKVWNALCKAIASEIKRLLDILNIKEKDLILIAGLGNSEFISDSVGPKSCAYIKDAISEKRVDGNARSVYCIIPNTFCNAGINGGTTIRALANEIKPKAVLVIDSLAATTLKNFLGSIQINNTGIKPGVGFDNDFEELNADTLGVPIIAVGIPTLINIANIIADEFMSEIEGITDTIFVANKDIDSRIEGLAYILSNGITTALFE